MKSTLFLSFFLLLGLSASAQSETLTGKIVHKEWTMTIQSYCAGGSDYYVLAAADGSETILDVSAWSSKKLAKSTDKTVKIKGEWKEVKKEEEDNMSQHPVGGASCSIFVVKK